MSRKNAKSDLLTGAFTLFVLLAFFGVTMYLQDFKSESTGHRYTVRFQDSGGLRPNTPVLVAGQRVGQVETVETVPVSGTPRTIEIVVGLIIDDEFASKVSLPVDTVAQVTKQGLLGNIVLTLVMGQSTDTIKPGGAFPQLGRPATDIGDLVKVANLTIKKLDEGLEGIVKELGKPEVKDDLSASIASLKNALEILEKGLGKMEPAFEKVPEALESTQALVDEIRALITDNRESMDRIVVNLESTTSKFDKLMGEDESAVPHLVSNLNLIANNLDDLVANLNDVVLDNKLSMNISMENIRETTDSLRVFAKRIENDPSLLVWGDDNSEQPGLDQTRPTPNVDELEIRNSGRRPRKESD
ncbi:MAG: MlaD family protein [Planctomycetota bacterium]|jgi:phospholipid/cholesterol/gamma-HCH transport system substrate-binding protein